MGTRKLRILSVHTSPLKLSVFTSLLEWPCIMTNWRSNGSTINTGTLVNSSTIHQCHCYSCEWEVFSSLFSDWSLCVRQLSMYVWTSVGAQTWYNTLHYRPLLMHFSALRRILSMCNHSVRKLNSSSEMKDGLRLQWIKCIKSTASLGNANSWKGWLQVSHHVCISSCSSHPDQLVFFQWLSYARLWKITCSWMELLYWKEYWLVLPIDLCTMTKSAMKIQTYFSPSTLLECAKRTMMKQKFSWSPLHLSI